jgi:tetratricopeptide (TPR) repeat protein
MFAVVSQLTHGLFDFGMFLPANFMALAFLVGACAGRLSRIQNIRSTHWYTLPEHRWIPSLQATMVLLAVAWSWSEIRSASLVDQDVARCRALKNTDVENFVATERAIRKLEESIGRRDDDAEAWNELAAAHLRRYRQQLTNSPELGLAGSFQERFNQTELGTLNYAVMNLLRMKKTDELNRIRLHPATVESLSRARDCWRRAVRGCPLLLVPHLRLTESAAILTGTETPAEHGKALLLAPKNPAVLYWAGMLEFNAGRTEQSCVIWQKSIDQSSERTNDVFSLLTRRMSYSTIFDAVEPNGGGFLVSLAERVFDLEKPSPERELLIPKFRLMLAKKLFPPGDESYFEGMIAAHQSDRTKAIEALQTAVLSAPERVARRYSLALTLIAEHRETEAIAELEAAQKYEPMNQTIRGTLNRLKGKPKTTAER